MKGEERRKQLLNIDVYKRQYLHNMPSFLLNKNTYPESPVPPVPRLLIQSNIMYYTKSEDLRCV